MNQTHLGCNPGSITSLLCDLEHVLSSLSVKVPICKMGIIRKCTFGRVYVEHLEEWLENSKSSVNFSSLHLTKLDAHLPCPHDQFFPHTLALTLWCFHFIIPSLISSPSLSSLYPRVNRCICYGMGPFIPSYLTILLFLFVTPQAEFISVAA